MNAKQQTNNLKWIIIYIIYINSNAKVAKALRSEENLDITLGAKKEKPVAVKYMIPKATAPKDSVSHTKHK